MQPSKNRLYCILQGEPGFSMGKTKLVPLPKGAPPGYGGQKHWVPMDPGCGIKSSKGNLDLASNPAPFSDLIHPPPPPITTLFHHPLQIVPPLLTYLGQQAFMEMLPFRGSHQPFHWMVHGFTYCPIGSGCKSDWLYVCDDT